MIAWTTHNKNNPPVFPSVLEGNICPIVNSLGDSDWSELSRVNVRLQTPKHKPIWQLPNTPLAGEVLAANLRPAPGVECFFWWDLRETWLLGRLLTTWRAVRPRRTETAGTRRSGRRRKTRLRRCCGITRSAWRHSCPAGRRVATAESPPATNRRRPPQV